jgi:hypothetical protein
MQLPQKGSLRIAGYMKEIGPDAVFSSRTVSIEVSEEGINLGRTL